MKYGFLAGNQTIAIEANDIQSACDQMVEKAAQEDILYPSCRIDYEVEVIDQGSTVIDLYSILPNHKLVKLYVP